MSLKVTVPLTVRYGETDKMGVVYHANYLLYFEDARTEFLVQLGYPYKRAEGEGYLSPVLHFECDYREPLRYGERAFVVTWLSELKPTKVTFSYELYREGMEPGRDKPLVTGRSSHCLVEADSFKPVSTKRALPDLYARYQQAYVEG